MLKVPCVMPGRPEHFTTTHVYLREHGKHADRRLRRDKNSYAYALSPWRKYRVLFPLYGREPMQVCRCFVLTKSSRLTSSVHWASLQPQSYADHDHSLNCRCSALAEAWSSPWLTGCGSPTRSRQIAKLQAHESPVTTTKKGFSDEYMR